MAFMYFFWIIYIVLTTTGIVWISTMTEATLPGRVPWLSTCSVGSPGYSGKVREQEAAEDFTPKSAPLGHKSGISCREIKSNTYGTSTHFSCFLQNRSSCKTVIIEILQQVSIPCLPKDTVAIKYHRRSGVPFLKFGDQTCPSFISFF